MNSIVKLLRKDGKRRRDHDISADVGVRGTLSLYSVEGTHQLNLDEVGIGGKYTHLVPTLFHPRLVAIGDCKLLFEGVERIDPKDRNSQTMMQEWAVQIFAPREK